MLEPAWKAALSNKGLLPVLWEMFEGHPNLLPAFLNVPLYRYAVSTFVGIIPGALVFTSVGAGLGEVFAAGETPNLGIIFEPHIIGPILGLCALAALPIVLKAVTGKKGI